VAKIRVGEYRMRRKFSVLGAPRFAGFPIVGSEIFGYNSWD